jgi:predicted thioesterase
LPIVKRLVEFPGGPQLDLIDIKNEAGRTPIGEAALAGWDEGASWLVSVMKLDSTPTTAVVEDDIGAEDEGLGGEQVDIEVEVEDAQGQISRMSIKADGSSVSKAFESPNTNSAVP